jgi:hypothetical protein
VAEEVAYSTAKAGRQPEGGVGERPGDGHPGQPRPRRHALLPPPQPALHSFLAPAHPGGHGRPGYRAGHRNAAGRRGHPGVAGSGGPAPRWLALALPGAGWRAWEALITEPGQKLFRLRQGPVELSTARRQPTDLGTRGYCPLRVR